LTIEKLWLAHKQTSPLTDKKRIERIALSVKKRNINFAGLAVQKRGKNGLSRRI
jgi:hypothetical protein